MKCEAQGCPLTGQKEYESGKPLCYFHRTSSSWDGMTSRINNCLYAYEHWQMCKKATPYDIMSFPDKYHRHQKERLWKRDDENHYQYTDRIWEEIKMYVFNVRKSDG